MAWVRSLSWARSPMSDNRPELPPIGAGVDEYYAQALALLPRGLAWEGDAHGVRGTVLKILAGTMARVQARADYFLETESFPPHSFEMLADWERSFGLPDPCRGEQVNLRERRQSLTERITETGGQSRAYLTARALGLGYLVEIDERRPFQCGISACGGDHECADATLRYYWTMRVMEPRVTWFECGISQCGLDPLARIDRAEDLECVMARIAPAHTELTLAYQGGV